MADAQAFDAESAGRIASFLLDALGEYGLPAELRGKLQASISALQGKNAQKACAPQAMC